MTEQTFGYYQDPPSFSPFSLQYPQPSFDVGYIGSDNNPFDSDFTNTQSASQNDAPSWSGSFATPDTDGVSFQRRGAVSDAVPEQTGPETGGDTAPRGLRIDTSCGNLNVEHHVQEATANLGSPVNIRSQHLDSATTPTSFPPGPNNYETSTPPTNLDMNHRGALPSSLTMSQNSPYYMAGHQGVFDNQQLSHPHSAHPGRLNRQQLPQDSRHYAPSRSPQLLMHPLSAPPYGPSTQNGLSITYTPSSIASSSVRSVSPASTAATSAQPLDFSTYASPVGEYDVSAGECAAPAPSLSSLTLVNGSPHSPVVSVHPTSAHQSPLVSGAHTHPSAIRSSAGASRAGGNHTASPIRRRANKQRLDDARRKEICSYARDRPKARQEDIAIKYGVERSTISKILKHKDKWLSLDTNPRKSIPVKHSAPVCIRPSKFPEIETELLKWVKQCQENGTNITDTRIKAKAKECAAEIGLPEGKFKASSGWIENFKLRNNLTRRSQDEQDASPTQEATEDLDQMDEDEGMAITASQTTQIEADGYGAEGPEQDSFNSMLTVSTDPEPGLLPHETSFSTFSTDSMSSNTQDLSMFHSNTPLSSAASSFASSPSGARPQHVPNDPGLRSRAHSHSVAMRAVGPVGSPQPGAGLIQPMSPARLDMRFTSTPTSASIPRFPSPLSASTSASGNGLVMHNVRHSPASQKHSRHPSDASVFSYDVASQASTDISSIGPPLFEAPSPHQTLEAIDMVLKYFEQPQTAGIASHLDRRTFAEVRQRLAERLVQSLPLSSESGALGPDRGPA